MRFARIAVDVIIFPVCWIALLYTIIFLIVSIGLSIPATHDGFAQAWSVENILSAWAYTAIGASVIVVLSLISKYAGMNSLLISIRWASKGVYLLLLVATLVLSIIGIFGVMIGIDGFFEDGRRMGTIFFLLSTVASIVVFTVLCFISKYIDLDSFGEFMKSFKKS